MSIDLFVCIIYLLIALVIFTIINTNEQTKEEPIRVEIQAFLAILWPIYLVCLVEDELLNNNRK